VKDECRLPPRGRRQHRVAQRQARNQASDEQGLLGKRARQVPEYERQSKKRRSNGRVASDGDRYAARASDEVRSYSRSEGPHGWLTVEEDTRPLCKE